MYVDPKSSLADVILQWADNLSKTGTIHGLSWISYFKRPYLKALVLLFAGTCVVILPVYVFMEAKAFFNDPSISRLVSTKSVSNRQYPKITFCHPFYFYSDKLEALGFPPDEPATNEFATFLSLPMQLAMLLRYATYQTGELVFDNGKIYDVVLEQLESFKPRFTEAMASNESWSSVIDLYNHIAVPCEGFIAYCEINGQIYGERDCCREFFDPQPIYTALGTCYETRSDITLMGRLEGDSGSNMILIYLQMDLSRHPIQSSFIGGTTAFTRLSPWYLLSHDGVNAVNENNARLMPLNSLTFVPLDLIRIDRSRLLGNSLVPPDQQCMTKTKEFEERFGIPYSYPVCISIAVDESFGNCTSLPYWNLPNVRNKSICTPEHIVRPAIGEATAAVHEDLECLRECETIESKIEQGFIGDIDNRHFEWMEHQNTTIGFAAIKVYFLSWEERTVVLVKEGVIDFLSRIGGFMGLTLGASIISCAEVGAFFFQLCYLIAKWAGARMSCPSK